MKKTKFLPYLAKRIISWFITLAITVAIIVGLRVCLHNTACLRDNCDETCGKTWHPKKLVIHGCD